jgi:hypothetical protein
MKTRKKKSAHPFFVVLRDGDVFVTANPFQYVYTGYANQFGGGASIASCHDNRAQANLARARVPLELRYNEMRFWRLNQLWRNSYPCWIHIYQLQCICRDGVRTPWCTASPGTHGDMLDYWRRENAERI